jgi:hypothetical protein
VRIMGETCIGIAKSILQLLYPLREFTQLCTKLVGCLPKTSIVLA